MTIAIDGTVYAIKSHRNLSAADAHRGTVLDGKIKRLEALTSPTREDEAEYRRLAQEMVAILFVNLPPTVAQRLSPLHVKAIFDAIPEGHFVRGPGPLVSEAL